ncbi:class I SAM-dependent methyltransferase [Xanthomonas oryzae pv. oryzicola]|uniref:Methyltransferase in menaquinone-biotin biosynthesis n=1 Tax=Xanthomonas oryzae pv. oryzicola (strain BLS256) TaxID=383407 RepID=G7TFR0_XANOB|nr:class I SAM-dependent methyltransferase [Xanthomonas oryzae]AEQ97809.1 methyltransferase in menaquinone-biotin biosynthesis [Xanthomonas oryzae pv. oryzicola BLS256]AJQ88668.1 SAM-dependent methyltransferase [Xanthomonas oryzae pv. oryzicola]AKK65145.1 SAM-dependent methyltransferase [Xanthomonas oryzae pv. oryzicola]AKN94440.1 SAM-dependent methyltransferase [Xanthomonas oryzae pv. oryzicola]AKN98164.1 SAM-dependent methyltransferase [Xanthomonas oryzae pv. oryzicola]
MNSVAKTTDPSELSEHVAAQFGPQAHAYLHSDVHAQGAEFAELRAGLAGHRNGRLLDLGCGAGHVSFQLAPLMGEVVAYDLSADMLKVVVATAGERGLTQISTLQGVAERLPFEAGSMDAVVSRYSAHHWSDLGQALREVRRVLRPGGIAAFIDVVAPGLPLLDTHLQAIELLRDTSHVRDYSVAQWLQMVGDAGLQVQRHQCQRLQLDYASWVDRMRTPQVMREAIRALQNAAVDAVREHFQIDADGSFSTDVLVLWAVR